MHAYVHVCAHDSDGRSGGGAPSPPARVLMMSPGCAGMALPVPTPTWVKRPPPTCKHMCMKGRVSQTLPPPKNPVHNATLRLRMCNTLLAVPNRAAHKHTLTHLHLEVDVDVIVLGPVRASTRMPWLAGSCAPDPPAGGGP